MAVEILSAAEERLEQIWVYTEREWGSGQADRYLRGLAAAIASADRKRKEWKRFPGRSEIFYLRYKHHRIFVREFPDGVVGIITVLHESMDLSARLKEDAEPGGD